MLTTSLVYNTLDEMQKERRWKTWQQQLIFSQVKVEERLSTSTRLV